MDETVKILLETNKALMEANERTSASAGKRLFWTVVFLLILLAFSIGGNIYQATQKSEISVENSSSFEQSNNNINTAVSE
jgi:hypothetical protein